MSVLQPFQFMKFTQSIDNQSRYQEGCGYDLCNVPVMPQGKFVPFGIVSGSNTVGDTILKCHAESDVVTLFESDFSQWVAGFFPGFEHYGLPAGYATYVIDKYNDQCRITIPKADCPYKYAYLQTQATWFTIGHTYRISFDVIDCSTFMTYCMLNVSVFYGVVGSTQFISKFGWDKSECVKHWEFTGMANNSTPEKLFIAVCIPTSYVLPDDQWIIIDNLKIEELGATSTTSLGLSLSSDLLSDGNYFNYYNGADLDLDCGIYYLTVDIGGELWYSDLFHILDISGQSTIPEIKYKPTFLPLPIYDSIYKQNRYLCGDDCYNLLITPVNQIIPFFTDEVTFVDDSEVEIYLVNINTLVELEITAQLELDYGSHLYLYSAGGTFTENIDCGIYYLHIHTNSGDWYSEIFKILDITGLITPEEHLFLAAENSDWLIETENGENILIEP